MGPASQQARRTDSDVSDIAHRGLVYALDFAPGEMKKLILACEERSNMIPIFADANHPERYAHLVDEVDIIYQDIAQRNQAEIALRNVECFLTDGGYLILMIKARSIDSTAAAVQGSPRCDCETVRGSDRDPQNQNRHKSNDQGIIPSRQRPTIIVPLRIPVVTP